MFRRPARPVLLAGALIASSALALTGCSVNPLSTGAAKPAKASTSASPTPKVFTGKITATVRPHQHGVHLDKKLRVKVHGAALQDVSLRTKDGPVPGKFVDDNSTWRATGLLDPDTKYTLSAVAVDHDGLRGHFKRSFHTRKLTLDEQTYPSFYPTDGATVGIGMPVIIKFDVPVTAKARIEKHLHVTTEPQQVGAWHWISDNEVHWRPKHYWKAGTTVTVNADIGSVPAGNGIYGQLDRTETFHIGRAQVLKVNLDSDQLTVHQDGHVIRTIPVSAGKEPQFTTRSGTKVIVSKESHTRMNSETIGIDPNSPQGYDLDDVRYAMRLTFSGEYLHAAPWSVAAQGHANTSHGCTGMSMANAHWLFDHSMIGDPVEFSGTNRPMTLTNGYGDWNESFAEYKQGSALH